MPPKPPKPILSGALGLIAIMLILAGNAGLVLFILLSPLVFLSIILTGSAAMIIGWLTTSVAVLLVGLGTAVGGLFIAKRQNSSAAIPRFAIMLGERLFIGLTIGFAVAMIVALCLRSG